MNYSNTDNGFDGNSIDISQVSIVDVCEKEGIELKKSGNVLQGLCPLHQEKTPSFTVYPESNSWYCFGGCDCGGNPINLIERLHNKTFKEACEHLGIGLKQKPDKPAAKIPYTETEEYQIKTKLLKQLKESRVELATVQQTLDYGVTPEQLIAFSNQPDNKEIKIEFPYFNPNSSEKLSVIRDHSNRDKNTHKGRPYVNGHLVVTNSEKNRELAKTKPNFYIKTDYTWLAFGIQHLHHAEGKWAFITEGESDTIFCHHGLKIISMAFSQKLNNNDKIASFKFAKEKGVNSFIYIHDNDDSGQKQAKKIQQLGLENGVIVITIPITVLKEDAPQGYDLRDFVTENIFNNPDNDFEIKQIAKIAEAYRLGLIYQWQRQIDLETEKTQKQDKKQTKKQEHQAKYQEKVDEVNNAKESGDIPNVNWRDEVFNFLIGDDYWISHNGSLYKYNGKNYDLQDDSIVKQQIACFLNHFIVVNPVSLKLEKPYASSRHVDDVFKWINLLLHKDKRLINSGGLPLNNGVLVVKELENGEVDVVLENHDPTKFYFTYCSEVDYNILANPSHANHLLQCLDEPYKSVMVKTLSCILDLPLVRKKFDRVKSLICIGEGSNGKDTLRSVVSLLLGNKGITGCSLNDFRLADSGRSFNLNRLAINPRINWSSENKATEIDSIEPLKKAQTNDPLFIEGKGRDGFEVELNTIFIFNSNSNPILKANSKAIESRNTIIPFDKVYSINPKQGELKADPRFKHDRQFLINEVVPAFLNILIESFKDVVKNGINYDSAADYLQEVMLESNHLRRFSKDIGLEFSGNPEDIVYCGDIYKLLEQWYIENGYCEIDTTGKRPKKVWLDSNLRSDSLIKASHQVKARFKELFPKSKETKKDNKRGLSGLTIKNSDRLLFLTQQGLEITPEVTFSLSQSNPKVTSQTNPTGYPTPNKDSVATDNGSNLREQSNLPSKVKVSSEVSSNPCTASKSNLSPKNDDLTPTTDNLFKNLPELVAMSDGTSYQTVPLISKILEVLSSKGIKHNQEVSQYLKEAWGTSTFSSLIEYDHLEPLATYLGVIELKPKSVATDNGSNLQEQSNLPSKVKVSSEVSSNPCTASKSNLSPKNDDLTPTPNKNFPTDDQIKVELDKQSDFVHYVELSDLLNGCNAQQLLSKLRIFVADGICVSRNHNEEFKLKGGNEDKPVTEPQPTPIAKEAVVENKPQAHPSAQPTPKTEHEEKQNLEQKTVDSKIQEKTKKYTESLTDSQKVAFWELVEFIEKKAHTYHKLTGFAGTGKSYLVTQLIKYLQLRERKVIVASPTNKASKNIDKMASSNGLKIKSTTLAKLLGLQPEVTVKGKEIFISSNNDNDLDEYDVIFIDEYSMVSKENLELLHKKVSEAFTNKIKVIFVGDSAQLPPINEQTSPIDNWEQVKSNSTLSEIVRYSGELANATKIIRTDSKFNHCIYPFSTSEDKTIVCLPRPQWEEKTKEIFGSEQFANNPNYARVLVWRNKTADKLNELIYNALFNSSKPYELGTLLISKSPIFREVFNSFKKKTEWGIVENNSEEFKVCGPSNLATKTINLLNKNYVFEYWLVPVLTSNGNHLDLQILTKESALKMSKIKSEIQTKIKNFHGNKKTQWEQFFNLQKSFDNVSLAYALTTHKAQGSSINNVFIDVMDLKGCPDLQKIQYTACTRAVDTLWVPK
jgi:phage/plasmid-associated DNA primase